jgi:energy-coupling factor transport system permease protein
MSRRTAHALGDRALPRWTHPGAWWVWALGLATAASRTTNPLVLALIVAVAGWVVSRRRPDAPWSRSYAVFLRLGLLVIAIRVAFTVLLGTGIGEHVLVTLPEIPLPDWMAGVSIGGPVTAEEVLLSVYLGMVLATMLACIGAANSLASPARLLASVPAALYEVGVAVVVAMTFAPQLVGDVARVRTARRLRGRSDRGVRAFLGSVMPVLEGALERAVDLAAAMDSRGYGRTGPVAPRVRRTASALLLLGVVGVCLGVYAMLDGGTPGAVALPLLALGVVAGLVGMRLAGRRAIRTRYRPDPWALPEWLVSLSGVVPAVTMVVVSVLDPDVLVGATAPPTWPSLPLVPALAVVVAALAGVFAPRPPGTGTLREVDRARRPALEEVAA